MRKASRVFSESKTTYRNAPPRLYASGRRLLAQIWHFALYRKKKQRRRNAKKRITKYVARSFFCINFNLKLSDDTYGSYPSTFKILYIPPHIIPPLPPPLLPLPTHIQTGKRRTMIYFHPGWRKIVFQNGWSRFEPAFVDGQSDFCRQSFNTYCTFLGANRPGRPTRRQCKPTDSIRGVSAPSS